MGLYDVDLYLSDVEYVAALELPWQKLKNSTILITGATGLVGSFLVDVLMFKNENGLNCTIYALSRDKERFIKRFSKWRNNPLLQHISFDINQPFSNNEIDNVDYVLHLASNTHPLLYSTDPIGTITTNIYGVQNLLDFCIKHESSRFVFASSNEVYGENRGDVELFNEEYCGYINCNTVRAGYPESKRCGEALCQAYRIQKGIDIVIPRLTRSYGPTMLMNDSKAISQFIKKAIAGEPIVLKSEGTQFYSYTYVADAVSGLLFVLLKGIDGEAYNIADISSDISLKDLAKIIAAQSNLEVVFELPDSIESAGYSKATKARLSGDKIKALGWTPKFNISSGVERTISILRSV